MIRTVTVEIEVSAGVTEKQTFQVQEGGPLPDEYHKLLVRNAVLAMSIVRIADSDVKSVS